MLLYRLAVYRCVALRSPSCFFSFYAFFRFETMIFVITFVVASGSLFNPLIFVMRCNRMFLIRRFTRNNSSTATALNVFREARKTNASRMVRWVCYGYSCVYRTYTYANFFSLFHTNVNETQRFKWLTCKAKRLYRDSLRFVVWRLEKISLNFIFLDKKWNSFN